MLYFPQAHKETLKMPRSYIANVLHTVIGQNFIEWTDKIIRERNQKVQDTNSMAINMDAEIAEVFKHSNHVSSRLYALEGILLF